MYKQTDDTTEMRGIRYQNGYFEVLIPGIYRVHSQLKIDTRSETSDRSQVTLIHCVKVSGTTQPENCSKKRYDKGWATESEVDIPIIKLEVGQKLSVSVNKIHLIYEDEYDNKFSMVLTHDT